MVIEYEAGLFAEEEAEMTRADHLYGVPNNSTPQEKKVQIAVRMYREQGCTDDQVLAFVQETFPEVTTLPSGTLSEGGSP